MDYKNIIQTFGALIGQKIIDIKYIGTEFHYNLNGDWSNVNTNLFVLHSPEWELNLSNGNKWFLTNPQGDLSLEAAKSNITVSASSVASPDDKIHAVTNIFGWSNVLGQEIKAVKFFRRVIKTNSVLGFEFGRTYQDNIQIIQLFSANNSFVITTMDGDIGHSTFYPTGYLGNRLGFFFDKTIADYYSVYENTDRQIKMRFEMVYQLEYK